MAVGVEPRYLKFMLRRRPRLGEDMAELNASILARFAQVPGFWRPGSDIARARLLKTEESLTVDLRHARKVLIEGLGGQMRYHTRFPMIVSDDDAMNDDALLFGLDTALVDHVSFCRSTLPRLIEIFEPYRMEVITDEALSIADWEIVCAHYRETRRSIEGRHGVFRIWPVCYFDDLLCRRAFGLAAAEVVARAAPECERAELINGGAFLLATTAIVTGAAELDAMDARLRARLSA